MTFTLNCEFKKSPGTKAALQACWCTCCDDLDLKIEGSYKHNFTLLHDYTEVMKVKYTGREFPNLSSGIWISTYLIVPLLPSVSHGWCFLRFAPLESACVFPGSPAVSGSDHAAFDILSTHSVFSGGTLIFLIPGKSYRALKLWILNPLTCTNFLVLSHNC